jgi:hypothetical protein
MKNRDACSSPRVLLTWLTMLFFPGLNSFTQSKPQVDSSPGPSVLFLVPGSMFSWARICLRDWDLPLPLRQSGILRPFLCSPSLGPLLPWNLWREEVSILLGNEVPSSSRFPQSHEPSLDPLHPH